MHGQVVVITGAAGGIGGALATRCLEKGAAVWGFDRDQETLKRMEDDARKIGKDFRAFPFDITSIDALREAREAVIKECGKIDTWVNNAGIGISGNFKKMSWDTLEAICNVNFLAVVRGTRLALEHMEEQGGGCIVNIASVAGHVPSPFLTAYAATKHGVVGLTRSLRQELKIRSSSVRTLLVCPGFVNTPMIARGQAAGFPEWLTWSLGESSAVADAIVAAIRKGREEIYPTWNGKALIALNKVIPERLGLEPSKMVLSSSFKDYLLNRFREK